MASNDDFREQLRTGNITDALVTALTKAIELKVTTWVASADDIEATEAKPGHRLQTRINMIEGKLENEIGDKFIANGRYRELRQFHVEQVAEGNKIIQNNLKSLQKLFELLVTMRYQGTTPPGIEPSSGVDSQQLPPSDAIAQLPTFPEPSSSSATPVDSLQELSEDDEDDWDDSVLNLLESLPVAPPPSPNTLDPQFDEDRRNLIEELELEPPRSNLLVHQDWATLTQDDFTLAETSPTPNSEAPPQIDENLGELLQEPKPKPPISAPVNQMGALTKESEPPTTSLTNVEALNLHNDKDWGDLVAAEPKANQDKPVPNMESLDLAADEDWDSWDVEDPLHNQRTPVNHPEILALDEDEDWGDLLEDAESFATAPADRESDLAVDQDWDDFTIEEPKPDANFIDVEAKTVDTDSDVSKPPTVSEDNLDAKQKSVDKQVPPPPPPSRFPNQNNKK